MSQIYVPTTTTNPAIPTSFETQDGTAVPLANTLIIDAFDSSEDGDNGLTTKGGVSAGDPPGGGATNEVSIYLTNRKTGQATTSDDTPTTIISLSLGGTAATYLIYGNIQAFNSATPAGASYSVNAAFRTTGGVAIFIAGDFSNIFEEVALEDCEINFDAVGNSAVLSVTGIGGGSPLTINWNAMLEYRMVT